MIQKYEIYRKNFRNLCFLNKQQQQQRCMTCVVFQHFSLTISILYKRAGERKSTMVLYCFLVGGYAIATVPSLKLFSGLCADTANIQPSEANKCCDYEITARIKRKQPNRINKIRPSFHWKMPNNKATGSQVVYKHPK